MRTRFLAIMEQRLILINLLIKLGVAASVASTLVRSVEFKSLLFREERTLKQKIYLVSVDRHSARLGRVDPLQQPRALLPAILSFETTILLGVIAGRFAGMLAAYLLALPAVLHGEWATLPFNVLCGFIAGQLRNLAPDREDIWSFSPFIDLSIYRMIRRNLPTPRLFDWQIMFFATIVGLRFVQTEISRFLPHATFSLESPTWWVEVADLCDLGHGDRNRAENLEQRAHPDQAGRAGAPAAARPHGGAAEPDQSALPVQYVEFGFVAGALRSRHRARNDHQAGQRFCGAC